MSKEDLNRIKMIQSAMSGGGNKVFVETKNGERFHIDERIHVGDPASNLYNALTIKSEHIKSDMRRGR